MRIIIITGMSGAGKSTTVRLFEDMGYFCVDNLPPTMIPEFIQLCSCSQAQINNIAIVVDSRLGYFIKDLSSQLINLKELGYDYKMLFLDASDEELIKRYKENRRTHPLARQGNILKGIGEEREILSGIKNDSDYIIDTTGITSMKLRTKIYSIFENDENIDKMLISIFSFGFKYRVPVDADLLFDVRFIPNPYYIEELRKLTGEDAEVKEYVFNQKSTNTFLDKLKDMLDFLVPNYVSGGYSQLNIGIGCTGGQHRSVVISKEAYEYLTKNGYKVILEHRDIEKALYH